MFNNAGRLRVNMGNIYFKLGQYGKADLEAGGIPYSAENSIYQSDILKLLFGNH